MKARLFIGVLLPDSTQQEYNSDAISNRSLNRVSVGIWWIFGWGRKDPSRSSLHEEDESVMGSCWPLGSWSSHKSGPQGRMEEEADWAGLEKNLRFWPMAGIVNRKVF
jgi:hypothetical protein